MSSELIQALGFMAFGINLLAGSTVNDNRMRALICCSCLLFSTHYFFMGAVVAAINLLINSVRAFVSLRLKGAPMFWLFLAIQTVMTITYYSEAKDLLPWLASSLSCWALFLGHGLKMRLAFLLCTLIWLVNAVIVGSYGGMLNDIFNAIVLSTTVYRLYRLECQPSKET
ncbi:YgjV family protein [Vibrio mediterranei]|uniref:YgjV family protein n=1 Tax=Vibrio mediterranei TaxID=689 RepID=A0ABX5DIQ1_9VIBR|nr:YgjV family protein [Vibrio mediterranei]PCD89127.1 hypothetical protein COR52_08340 [Vibrio mediterranei]PRQ68702.1 hypothetical protein COR51_04670 [Vibrio mediterranei]